MSIISSYPLLSQEEVQTARRLGALLASKSYGAANALHELISGAPGPGGQGLLFKPHDHCEVGVSLPRASQWSFAWPVGTAAEALQVVILYANTWYHRPRVGITYYAESGAGEADLMLYVTPGVDVDNTAVGTNPCGLEAKITFGATGGTTKLRFWNRTTKTASSTYTTTTSGILVTLSVTDIPCRGGSWNAIDVEIQSDTAAAQITVWDLVISETRTASQPASSGTATLTGATKP